MVHKNQKEVDIKLICDYINKGLSLSEIMNKTSYSSYLIYKHLKKEDKIKLKNINIKKSLEKLRIINKKIHSTRKGHSARYKKILLEIRNNKHKCDRCGSLKNIEIHHKEKLKYDSNFNNWKSSNFNNYRNNIQFLCNSCHQKLHYRELGRKSLVKHDPKTGRFMKNES